MVEEGARGWKKNEAERGIRIKYYYYYYYNYKDKRQRLKLRMKDKTKTEIKDNKCEWPICDGGYKNENGECDISYLIKTGLVCCINGHQIGGRGKKLHRVPDNFNNLNSD